MTGPTPTPSILEITPYVPGKHAPAGARTSAGAPAPLPLKLSANESALGPSPKAIAALEAQAARAHRYPDGDATELRAALAERYQVPANQLVCGAGSDELIALTCQAYLAPGDEVLYPEHGFLMYKISALAAGGTVKTAPERGLRTDVAALLAAVSDKTKIVFLANPNNPTGSYITRRELADLHAGLPPHVLLVVDGAYREYVAQPDYSSGIELVSAPAQNVLVTGTLSKIFGLGGLRVGWAYGPPPLIDILNRVRGPFNVNALALAAATAAVQDRAFEARVRQLNNDQIGPLTQGLQDLGLSVYPSVGNFLLIDFGEEARRLRIDAALQAQGIFIRQVAAYGLPTCLRMTIGTQGENARVLTALSELL